MPKIESAMIVPQAVWNRLPLEVGAALAERLLENGGNQLLAFAP